MNDIMDLLDENLGEHNNIACEGFSDPELDQELFLIAMEESCTPEEFNEIVLEGAQDLELYGIIKDAGSVLNSYDIAQEAGYNKKIIVKQTRDVVMDRIEKRACIRLEQQADSALWRKYKTGRTMMIEAREAIYKKNGSKAAAIAKRAMQNAGRKAAAMQSKKGATITDKMDATIDRMQRNAR